MSLIRPLVILAALFFSVAMTAERVPESVLLKQQGLPSARSASPATKIKPPPTGSASVSVVTPIAITDVSVQEPADPLQVPLYGTLELVVTITTDVTGTQRYNPDPATGGLDLSTTFTGPGASPVVITRNGFYHGSSNKWLVRFAPTVVGDWTCTVKAKDSSNPSPGVTDSSVTFTCVASDNPGFIHISGSRLRFNDNSLFYGIGHNNGWQTDVEQPSHADMKTNGENLLSFWISQPWPSAPVSRKPIENITAGIGNYSQATCDYLDAVFHNAEVNGIYLLPSIWSHDALRADIGHPWGPGYWSNNAYSHPSICADPLGFFITTSSGNDTLAWTYQKRFLRYLTARYGHSTALVGWIGLVEMEGTSGYEEDVNSPAKVIAWCQQVRNWFIANDPYRVNSGTYPISFSKTDNVSGNNANTLGATAGFPLHVADSYASQNSNSAIAATIATATRTMGGFGVSGGAPAFHTEFGAPTNGSASDPLHFHNAIWAGVSAGASLMPLKWCDDVYWPLFNDGTTYRDHTRYLSEFINTDAMKTLMNNDAAVAATIAAPAGVAGWGLKTANTGFVWLHRPTGGSIASTAATVTGCSTGHYLLEWLNPWTNAAVSSVTDIASGSTLALTVPASITTADVAVRFRRAFTATDQSVAVDAKDHTIITLTGAGGGTVTGATVAIVPTRGLLFQVGASSSKGAAIATGTTTVTDSALRVWYEAPTPGTDDFTFTVTNGTSTSTTGTVAITARNHRPSFSAGSAVTVAEDSAAYSAAWAANISSDNTSINSAIDGTQALSFQLTSNTNATLFATQPAISSLGVLTFIPAANRSGTATITVALKDNGGNAGGGNDTSTTTPLTITISAANDAPVATPLTIANAYPGQGKSIALAGTDVDGDALTFVIDAAPLHGTLSAATGTPVTYTATSGYDGSDSFTYHANDGHVDSAIVTVNITVLANQAPTAAAQSVPVAQNTAIGVTLTGNDPDTLPNATLAFAVVDGPTHGTLSGAAPFLTYLPAAGYVGADSFTFTVNDGALTSPTATVAITITAGGGPIVPVGHTTSGGGCGLGGSSAAVLLGLVGLFSCFSRLVRRRAD